MKATPPTSPERIAEPLEEGVLERTRAAVRSVLDASRENDRVLRRMVPRIEKALREAEIDPKGSPTRKRSSTVDEIREKHGARAGDMMAFIDTLNAESSEGYRHVSSLLELPIADWDRWLVDHPEGYRHGTFDYLISEADETHASAPERAHEITSFVLRHLNRIPVPEHGAILGELLPGRLLLAHARTLVVLGDYEAAILTASAADEELSRSPAFMMDRMRVQLLRAQIEAALAHHGEALAIFGRCAHFFTENTDNWAAVESLCGMAVILCQRREFAHARTVLLLAEQIADRNGHERPRSVVRATLEQCSAFGYRDSPAPKSTVLETDGQDEIGH